MATPYTVECIFQRRNGTMGQLHLTVDDVTAHFFLAPSGASDLVLDSGDVKIVRMLYSGTPATTTTAQVFINGANTGIVLVGASNAPAAVVPQINWQSPMYLNGGSQIRFVQV